MHVTYKRERAKSWSWATAEGRPWQPLSRCRTSNCPSKREAVAALFHDHLCGQKLCFHLLKSTLIAGNEAKFKKNFITRSFWSEYVSSLFYAPLWIKATSMYFESKWNFLTFHYDRTLQIHNTVGLLALRSDHSRYCRPRQSVLHIRTRGPS